MKLTALIPPYNDDYALGFCLASIVDHFDEIIVLDDASTDDTPDVAADFARRHRHVRHVRHEGRLLGWVQARNQLAALTDADHLLWLDADDVLCEYNAGMLEALAQSPSAMTLLLLCEMWGDFHHTTQPLKHADPCHLYMNRRAVGGIRWEGVAVERQVFGSKPAGCGVSGWPLFFHIKGVKPDRRLAERRRMRDYLRTSDRPESLGVYAGKRTARARSRCPATNTSSTSAKAGARKRPR